MTTNNYYAMALNDARALEYIRHTDLHNHIAVQSQQVIEKLLKHLLAVFCVRSAKVSKALQGNNLVNLYVLCVEHGLEIDLSRKDLRTITNYYFTVQYPGPRYRTLTEEEANMCLTAADSTLKAVKNILLKRKYCTACGNKVSECVCI